MKMGVEKRKTKKTDQGFALLEAVTFLFVFVVLTAYAMDFFTIIHTGIVNSIAARTYLFETLQHRSNIAWLRASDEAIGDKTFRFDITHHERMHAVADEDQPLDDQTTHVPARRITQAEPDGKSVTHSLVNFQPLDNPNNKASTIYIKTGYGICVDAQCPPGG